jgi:hypothetical protein
MKKLFMFLSAAALTTGMMVSCSGCGSNGNTEEAEPPMFTKADTLQLLDLLEQFNEHMKAGDIPGATSMIYFLNGDSIEELNDMFRQRQALSLALVRGVDYQIDRIILNSEVDNEAKIDIVLFEKPEGDTRPNTTSFYFRPVRMDGKWYLTTKDNITDTRSDLRNKREVVETPAEENAEEE